MELQPKQLDKATGTLMSFSALEKQYRALCNGLAADKKKQQGRLGDFGLRTTSTVHWLLPKISCTPFCYVNLQEVTFLEGTNTLPGKIAKVQKR